MSDGKDPDPDLAAELRQTAGVEWAEEAAEDERLTELARRRKLAMSDILEELLHRGARVTVAFGGHTVSGAVVAAGTDYATIEGRGQIADVRLDTGVWSVIAPSSVTEPRPAMRESFRALLHEHAAGGAFLLLAMPDEESVPGTVDVVAVDHIQFKDADGRLHYIPLSQVLGVIRSADSH